MLVTSPVLASSFFRQPSSLDFCKTGVEINGIVPCPFVRPRRPYNNPQTLVFARMKHNTCVMRLRSLHRRLLLASGTDLQLPAILDEQVRPREKQRLGKTKHSKLSTIDRPNLT